MIIRELCIIFAVVKHKNKKVMNKDELLKKLSSVQDSIISICNCNRVIDAHEEILTALAELLDIKIEIEEYCKFVEDGV